MDTATELEALEAIRRLKYAYFRTLDLKQFEDLGALLTEDATSAYEDGRTVLEGRAAIVAWLTQVLGDAGVVTEHHGHHPEITFTSDSTATGTWYLQDRVIVPAHDVEISGTAFYDDRYRLTEDGWRIAHTGYTRVFEERRTHSTWEVRSFTSRFGSPG
jgi:SnoaL-like domain